MPRSAGMRSASAGSRHCLRFLHRCESFRLCRKSLRCRTTAGTRHSACLELRSLGGTPPRAGQTWKPCEQNTGICEASITNFALIAGCGVGIMLATLCTCVGCACCDTILTRRYTSRANKKVGRVREQPGV